MNISFGRTARGPLQFANALTFAFAAMAVALCTSSSAIASLQGTTYSVRYDGHVKSGLNVGVEGHMATHTFGVGLPHNLPGTTDPPAPLLNANDLRILETEAANQVILTINSANVAGDVFANPLDPAFLVEFEGIFQWDDLDPLEKIVITEVGIESFNSLPFPPPATSQITGTGSAADPVRMLLGIDPSLVSPNNNGFVKIRFKYERMVIPEPTTAMLTGIGMAGILGLIRRRRR